MLYTLHELGYQAAVPSRQAARAARDFWGSPLNPAGRTELGRIAYAGASFYADVTRRHGKPEWGIPSVEIAGQEVRVRPTPVWRSPWATLLHFARDQGDLRRAGVRELQPAILLVAPLS